MELPGKRELREQILHQMDGRTSYVSDKDVYRGLIRQSYVQVMADMGHFLRKKN